MPEIVKNLMSLQGHGSLVVRMKRTNWPQIQLEVELLPQIYCLVQVKMQFDQKLYMQAKKMLSFASLATAESICHSNLPFRWHPSKPMIGLQPPKKPTFYALYLIYILLNLGCAFSSSILVCKITLLPLSFNLIISSQSLSFPYCNYSSPIIKSVAFLFAPYT